MRKITVLFYPRTTKHGYKEEINGELNPDFVGLDNLPEDFTEEFAFDFTDLVRMNLYFPDTMTNNELHRKMSEFNNTGMIAISKYWEEEPDPEE